MSEGMSVALIGFAGVVIGALLTPIIEAVKSWYLSRKHATYLALRVVCILDQFIDACAEVVGEHGEEDEDGICRCSALPDAPSFPDDLDWKSIDNKLMYEILSLPNKVDYAKRKIWHTGEVTGPPYDEVGIEREREFALLRLAAHDLTVRLRKAYGISRESSSRSWDVVGFLSERKRKVEELKAAQEEAHKLLFANAVPPASG